MRIKHLIGAVAVVAVAAALARSTAGQVVLAETIVLPGLGWLSVRGIQLSLTGAERAEEIGGAPGCVLFLCLLCVIVAIVLISFIVVTAWATLFMISWAWLLGYTRR